jgi:hypothetical protein
MYIGIYVCMVCVCMYVFDKFHTAPAEENHSYPYNVKNGKIIEFVQNIDFQSVLCNF